MSALITISQLARQLKAEDPATAVARKTLRRFCRDGMRYYLDSNRFLTKREWYEEFVQARTSKAAPDAAVASE